MGNREEKREADTLQRWNRVLGEMPMVIAPDAKEAARSAALLYARCRWGASRRVQRTTV